MPVECCGQGRGGWFSGNQIKCWISKESKDQYYSRVEASAIGRDPVFRILSLGGTALGEATRQATNPQARQSWSILFIKIMICLDNDLLNYL